MPSRSYSHTWPRPVRKDLRRPATDPDGARPSWAPSDVIAVVTPIPAARRSPPGSEKKGHRVRYFSHLAGTPVDALFHRLPTEFSQESPPETLAMALGATLY